MYKGAIIGFGKIARTNHIEAYRNEKLKNDLLITAAVEPNGRNIEKSKEEFPEINFYRTTEELFKNEELILWISQPHQASL
jgi:predicted dehydrogenase